MKQSFTHEEIRELLNYDPFSGKLYWRARHPRWFAKNSRPAEACARAWNNKHAGKEAFIRLADNGYLFGKIFMGSYSAQRVIWFWMTGVWPDEVDHENGDKQDNRWSNLRDVSHLENCRNIRKDTGNKYEHFGVGFHIRVGRYRAYITVNKKMVHIGYYDTIEEAIEARKQKEIELGFHPNHKFQKAS